MKGRRSSSLAGAGQSQSRPAYSIIMRGEPRARGSLERLLRHWSRSLDRRDEELFSRCLKRTEIKFE